jgi:uncharacterized protein (TIGR02598 family)
MKARLMETVKTEVRSQKSEVRSRPPIAKGLLSPRLRGAPKRRFDAAAAVSCLLPSARSAFSLVEVAVAVAVIAIGLLVILGMFPQGLQASRNAADNTLSAMIAQDIFNDVRAQSVNPTFSLSLPSPNLSLCIGCNPSQTLGYILGSDTAWFDAQGNIVAGTDPSRYFKVQATYNPYPGGILPLSEVIVTVAWPGQSAAPANKNVFITKIAKYN